MAAAKAAQNEMYQALLTKRQQLVKDLESRAAQYKDLLVQEMVRRHCHFLPYILNGGDDVIPQQITGIPPDGLTSEEIERMRKKFGVSFKFSKFVLDDSTAVSLNFRKFHTCQNFEIFPFKGSSEVEELEKQLEVQSSIIEASKVCDQTPTQSDTT